VIKKHGIQGDVVEIRKIYRVEKPSFETEEKRVERIFGRFEIYMKTSRGGEK